MAFEKIFEKYLEESKNAHTEASKAFLFLSFARNVFSEVDAKYLDQLFPYLEEYLTTKKSTIAIKGRPDALLGNLIIEFKTNLDDQIEEAQDQLKKYISIIWLNEGKIKYLLFASDGNKNVVYRPKLTSEEIIPENIELEELDKITLDSVDKNYAYIWLDRYLLFKTLLIPKTENFVQTFGTESLVYKQASGMLKDYWNKSKEIKDVKLLFREWSKYLEIVYGGKVGSDELFLRHTYLAMLAKLMAYMFYSEGAIPSPDEVLKILNGQVFKKWGIQNFLEEDFFTWPLRGDTGFVKDFSKHLMIHLKSFDLTKLTEDVLKDLYQELVDPEERHDLGEYYTPDWLAETIVEDVLKDADKSILDPACGSGTFLVSSIKIKKKLMVKKDKSSILNNILTTVVGIDVHPLAVITSRVNYLLSLGDLIHHKKQTIFIPIYLANSIRLPKYEEILGKTPVYSFKVDDHVLQIPAKIVKTSEFLDKTLDTIKQIVIDGFNPDHFIGQLQNEIPKLNLNDKEIEVLKNLTKNIAEIKNTEGDTIWTYILKNIYKPISLKEKGFDFLVGNPPWLPYRDMGIEYQKFIKSQIIKEHKLLQEGKAEEISNMEIATLFFVKCADLYLKNKGNIEFVMPRSIFSSNQHNVFREGTFKPQIEIKKVIDLEHVDPLFNVPSCVVHGRLGSGYKYPFSGLCLKGKLSRKNAEYLEAKKQLESEDKKYHLNKIGDISFWWDKKLKSFAGESYYKKRFERGAELTPRNFWFVEIQKHPRFGINPLKPYVITSKTVNKVAKKEYKGFIIQHNIEQKFLYCTLRGTEIFPYGHLSPLLVVLPLMKSQKGYIIVDKQIASTRGYGELSNWIDIVEKKWKQERKSKTIKYGAVQYINYRQKLTKQDFDSPYKVLYTTSATHISSCLVDIKKDKLQAAIDGINIPLKGFVAETTTYYYDTKNKDEAYYLMSILNSPILNKLIKGAQAKGKFGERHIHKKLLNFPIPKYNPLNSKHKKIVSLAMICEKKVNKASPQLFDKYKSIGYIREKIRKDVIPDELSSISDLVMEIFTKESGKGTLDSWT